MSNYREPQPQMPPEPKPPFDVGAFFSKWAVAILIAGVVTFLAVFTSCMDRLHKQDEAEKDAWCCAKPRIYCRRGQECTHRGDHYCLRYENIEKCDNLCDEWRHEPHVANSDKCPAK